MRTLQTPRPKFACQITGGDSIFWWCYKFSSFRPGPKFKLLKTSELDDARRAPTPYIVMGFYTRKDAEDQARRLRSLLAAPQYIAGITVSVVRFPV